MTFPYAEVIGDPVAHSKSPLIHKFWLEKLGIEGDFHAVRVLGDEIGDYLSRRCADPFWRGCNVTAPLKEKAAAVAADPTGLCARIGAVNAIFRSPLGCGVGANTDVLGLAEALGGNAAKAERVCVIGCGGAARAAFALLAARSTPDVRVVARDGEKAEEAMRALGLSGSAVPFDAADAALAGAQWVINATPLGMAGEPPMPPQVLEALEGTDERAVVLDMVYAPLRTELLRRAAALGRHTADGLAMLIGQAAPSFELFFGTPAPREHDAALRGLLTS